MKEITEHQNFRVGLKAFIADGDRLLILQDNDGLWELPGGRIEGRETHRDIKDILVREVTEELGENIQYKIGPVFHAWIREPNKDYFIFLIGFRCEFQTGTIQISKEHHNFKWVTKEEVDALEFENTYKNAIRYYFENLDK